MPDNDKENPLRIGDWILKFGGTPQGVYICEKCHIVKRRAFAEQYPVCGESHVV